MRSAEGRDALVSLEPFFEGHDGSRPLFDAVSTVVAGIGPAVVRATRSQITLRRRAFARTGQRRWR